jgi:glycosyltransferase involved in cell wall biosynthesis
MIIINGRFLGTPQPTGTHRASRGLLKSMRPYLDDFFVYGRTALTEDELTELNLERHYQVRNPLRLPNHLWEQFSFPFFQHSQARFSLMGSAPASFNTKRSIMVVHDINFELVRESFGFPFRLLYKFVLLQAARKCRHIFAISEYTKQQLVNRGIEADKISVYYQGPGIDPALLSSSQPRPAIVEDLAKSYILCVGSLQPHKNLRGVLDMYSRLRKKRDDVDLVVVGRPQKNFNKIEIEQWELEQPGVHLTGYVSDEELVGLYQHAAVFLFPSFEEGFGLPVVESFYAGCPVVTSNASCLPEIAGDAALLVDPKDPEEMLGAVESVIDSKQLSEELVAKGEQRSKLFQWDLAGKQVASKLHELEEACQ